jgi:hypothetical protein
VKVARSSAVEENRLHVKIPIGQTRFAIMMEGSVLRAKPLFCALIMLFVLGVSSYRLHSQVAEGSPAPVIVEVTNSYFTMGRIISGVYLKVLGDRTVECHTLRITGKELDIVKKRQLSQDEFRELLALVNESELLSARERYGPMRVVVDSWMEWDILIPRTAGAKEIAIADFSPTRLGVGGPYPDAVVKLGCSISRLRDEVYGDDAPRRRECEKILMAK